MTQDGGNLRIFSKCMNGAVADVMPIFDRVVFFWSDSR
jgi:Rps23 Pro-64 3,4-dihydroxylase Tpa1-like proline 4-hydroxylase